MTSPNKLTTALNEVLALLKQDQEEYAACIAVRVVFCLGSGLISVQGHNTKEDVQHEDWLIQLHDDHGRTAP